MNGPSRIAAAALALAAPCCLAPSESPVPGEVPLRATLRQAVAARQVPAWIERAVCTRTSELVEGCTELASAIAEEAAVAGLDPVLVLAIIEVESGWDPDAVSEHDARGLMQLRQPAIEGEARGGRLGSTDPHDPLVNVRAGIRYFARLLDRFRDPELAMVAYNAGPRRLSGYLRAEEGVPERFWEYPRRIRREERRLRARLDGRRTLLVASAAR